jgi:hypothetical protein
MSSAPGSGLDRSSAQLSSSPPYSAARHAERLRAPRPTSCYLPKNHLWTLRFTALAATVGNAYTIFLKPMFRGSDANL